MAAYLTRVNNVFMWSDTLLSGTAFLALSLLAVFVSLLLCVFTPNQVH